jgi:hypothetical protein
MALGMSELAVELPAPGPLPPPPMGPALKAKV